jgi:hypothetical protein
LRRHEGRNIHQNRALVSQEPSLGLFSGYDKTVVKEAEPKITEDVFRVLGIEQSAARRASEGAAKPTNGRAAAAGQRFLD